MCPPLPPSPHVFVRAITVLKESETLQRHQGNVARDLRVIRHLDRRVPERNDGVANVLVHDAVRPQDQARHFVQVLPAAVKT